MRWDVVAARIQSEALPHHFDGPTEQFHVAAGIRRLKSRSKHILDDLGHVQTAAGAISRRFADVQVSDLKGIKISAEPHSDTLAIIKGLVGLEELDLWANEAPLETVIKRTRDWLDKTPVVRIAELFGLVVSVTGADEKVKHYKDFTQIESDGTTVTIKVLFNLLVLKSLSRRRAHRHRAPGSHHRRADRAHLPVSSPPLWLSAHR